MSFLESQYLYLGLLIFSISYPLAQSFEKRIQLYKQFKSIVFAISVMSVLFIPWDIWFTKKGVWWFNRDYITGVKLFHLPIEEWLFFIIVPYACLFIYEVLNYFFKTDYFFRVARWFFTVLAGVLLIAGTMHATNYYTSVTFFLTFIGLVILVYRNPKWIGRFLFMYLVSWLPFLLINGALTGTFTQEPVVNYNPDEIIGFRVLTIPIEDSVYNLLMLLIVVAVYENKKAPGIPRA